MGRRCMGGRREAAYKYSQINDVTVCVCVCVCVRVRVRVRVRKSFAKKVSEQSRETLASLKP